MGEHPFLPKGSAATSSKKPPLTTCRTSLSISPWERLALRELSTEGWGAYTGCCVPAPHGLTRRERGPGRDSGPGGCSSLQQLLPFETRGQPQHVPWVSSREEPQCPGRVSQTQVEPQCPGRVLQTQGGAQIPRKGPRWYNRAWSGYLLQSWAGDPSENLRLEVKTREGPTGLRARSGSESGSGLEQGP